MAKNNKDDHNNNNNNKGKKRKPGSTTSLGKRRARPKSPAQKTAAATSKQPKSPKEAATTSTMSNPRSSEYGSQASPLRVPSHPKDLVKVTIVGAAGGIGQPLAMLLMMHSEYVHHLALYDLVDSLPGVGLDVSHMDRQVLVTTHLGPESLAEAVKGASVIIVLAGLAQKPGMSRDDLFGSNAKIMYNIAKCCAQNAPNSMLCIVTNPVNSLVPLTCEVYARALCSNKARDQHQDQKQQDGSSSPKASDQTQKQPEAGGGGSGGKAAETSKLGKGHSDGHFEDCFRRIFGVTTLDVVRASTLTAKSALFKNEPNGLFKDPGKVQVPVVGGHAGKTIMPILSQATPRLDRHRLQDDKATTSKLIEGVQQAGIDVLNAKKGKGSATLAMAYAACRFAISLLRAKLGETNIVECCYVRHAKPCCHELEYFAAPMLLGKDGYVSLAADYLTSGGGGGGGNNDLTTSRAVSGSLLSVGRESLNSGSNQQSVQSGRSGASIASKAAQQVASQTQDSASPSGGGSKLLPFELKMIEEGSRELRLSIAKGEDFAREQLSSEK